MPHSAAVLLCNNKRELRGTTRNARNARLRWAIAAKQSRRASSTRSGSTWALQRPTPAAWPLTRGSTVPPRRLCQASRGPAAAVACAPGMAPPRARAQVRHQEMRSYLITLTVGAGQSCRPVGIPYALVPLSPSPRRVGHGGLPQSRAAAVSSHAGARVVGRCAASPLSQAGAERRRDSGPGTPSCGPGHAAARYWKKFAPKVLEKYVRTPLQHAAGPVGIAVLTARRPTSCHPQHAPVSSISICPDTRDYAVTTGTRYGGRVPRGRGCQLTGCAVQGRHV